MDFATSLWVGFILTLVDAPCAHAELAAGVETVSTPVRGPCVSTQLGAVRTKRAYQMTVADDALRTWRLASPIPSQPVGVAGSICETLNRQSPEIVHPALDPTDISAALGMAAHFAHRPHHVKAYADQFK
jgi:hypothetical protein